MIDPIPTTQYHKTYNGRNYSCTLLEQVADINGKKAFMSKCSCGKVKVRTLDAIKRSVSCGCSAGHNKIRHGQGSVKNGVSVEYSAWLGMKNRCYNKNNQDYYNYGGREIFVSDEWVNSFETFFKDMGVKPSKLHSLDRIDTNKIYSKENCKWSTPKEQARNRNNNRKILFNGELMFAQDISKLTNIREETIRDRHEKNIPISSPVIHSGIKMLNMQNGIFYNSISEAAYAHNICRGKVVLKTLAKINVIKI